LPGFEELEARAFGDGHIAQLLVRDYAGPAHLVSRGNISRDYPQNVGMCGNCGKRMGHCIRVDVISNHAVPAKGEIPRKLLRTVALYALWSLGRSHSEQRLWIRIWKDHL